VNGFLIADPSVMGLPPPDSPGDNLPSHRMPPAPFPNAPDGGGGASPPPPISPGRFCFGLDTELCSRLGWAAPTCQVALNVVCLLTGVAIFIALLVVAMNSLLQE
jgi:hypothetical protein